MSDYLPTYINKCYRIQFVVVLLVYMNSVVHQLLFATALYRNVCFIILLHPAICPALVQVCIYNICLAALSCRYTFYLYSITIYW